MAVTTCALQRRLARPHQDVHSESFAVACHRRADSSVPVDSERLAAQTVADPDLPGSGAKGKHLLRNPAHCSENQAKRQFRCGVRRTAGMLIGRYDDAATGTRVDVDVRVDTALADEPKCVEAFEQRPADLRTLANQHKHLRVPEARGELVDILCVVVPNPYFVPVELVKAWERTKGVEIVVENRNLHGTCPSYIRSPAVRDQPIANARPAATRKVRVRLIQNRSPATAACVPGGSARVRRSGRRRARTCRTAVSGTT